MLVDPLNGQLDERNLLLTHADIGCSERVSSLFSGQNTTLAVQDSKHPCTPWRSEKPGDLASHNFCTLHLRPGAKESQVQEVQEGTGNGGPYQPLNSHTGHSYEYILTYGSITWKMDEDPNFSPIGKACATPCYTLADVRAPPTPISWAIAGSSAQQTRCRASRADVRNLPPLGFPEPPFIGTPAVRSRCAGGHFPCMEET